MGEQILSRMCTVPELLSAFWNPKFWLPPGESWEFYNSYEDHEYVDHRHVFTYPIPIAVGILLFRFGLKKYCFKRLGLSLGLKNVKNKRAPSNPVLEKAFKACTKWAHKDITGLSKQTDWSERKIERWLRLRRMQGKSFTLDKFSENCWRCFYYFNIVIYGMTVLWTKVWLWDLDYCWINYPRQGLPSDIWWYYMISLGFYWSLLLSQFIEDETAHLWSSLIYHLVTIVVLSFSWICNVHRIICVLIMIHDLTNMALNAGKTFKYAKCDTLCYVFFFLFILLWFITRLIYLPFWILPSVLLGAHNVIEKAFPAYYLFGSFLIVLQIFHLYRSYFILKFLSIAINQRKVQKNTSNKILKYFFNTRNTCIGNCDIHPLRFRTNSREITSEVFSSSIF